MQEYISESDEFYFRQGKAQVHYHYKSQDFLVEKGHR